MPTLIEEKVELCEFCEGELKQVFIEDEDYSVCTDCGKCAF